jgi:hypothetical protein
VSTAPQRRRLWAGHGQAASPWPRTQQRPAQLSALPPLPRGPPPPPATHLAATQSNATFSQLSVTCADDSSVSLKRKGYTRKWRPPSSTGSGRPHVPSCSWCALRPTSSETCVCAGRGTRCTCSHTHRRACGCGAVDAAWRQPLPNRPRAHHTRMRTHHAHPPPAAPCAAGTPPPPRHHSHLPSAACTCRPARAPAHTACVCYRAVHTHTQPPMHCTLGRQGAACSAWCR